MNIQHYVTEEKYSIFAGEAWPSYQEFLAGERTGDEKIQQEIENLIEDCRRQGVVFPIKTETACQSKWTWSTIWLNHRATASCHRVNMEPIPLADFDNFHNLPQKINDRRLMLEGKWPGRGCEYCRNIELAGGHSDRQHNTAMTGLAPPELIEDCTAVVVTPRIVELFAYNTCNMSCVYCDDALSSVIANENTKFGGFNRGGVTISVPRKYPDISEYYEKFFQWLSKNISTLKRLHLLGGETFLQHDLMNRVIEELRNNPNPDLILDIFSNFNPPEKFWKKYLTDIKQLVRGGMIKRLDLTVSIDCWGKEAEYVRTGLDLELLDERFAWAATQNGDWLNLHVNQTITPMTMRTMPELIEKMNSYSNRAHIGHYFELYIGPNQFMNPKIFSYSMWENDFNKIFEVMPTQTVEHQESVLRMQGIQKFLKEYTEHDYAEIQKMKIYFDELDRRRGTNWRALFSYLDI